VTVLLTVRTRVITGAPVPTSLFFLHEAVPNITTRDNIQYKFFVDFLIILMSLIIKIHMVQEVEAILDRLLFLLPV
jgi:hypothetical protein